MIASRAISVAVLCGALGCEAREATPAAAPASTAAATAVEVAIPSGPYRLRAFVVRPEGDGRFPAIVYNHGSAREVRMASFAELGAWWAAHGYVVVFPFRRGTEGSPGPYWRDVAGDMDGADGLRRAVAQLEAENDDVVAGIAWARAQTYVDASRVVVAGCSFGGIHSLLAAERDSGARAALDYAGGAMSWADAEPVRERLITAARGARIPVFLIQAENDFDTTPSVVLDAEMTRSGRPHQMRIYPRWGETHKDGHAGFCVHGMPSWGDDVLAFLDRELAR